MWADDEPAVVSAARVEREGGLERERSTREAVELAGGIVEGRLVGTDMRRSAEKAEEGTMAIGATDEESNGRPSESRGAEADEMGWCA